MRHIAAVFGLVVFALFIAPFPSARTGQAIAAADAEKIVDCEIDKGPCSKVIGTMEVILDINPKPVKAMKELSFTVKLIGEGKVISGTRVITLDLAMPGMYMGKNAVMLGRNGPSTFSGKGVIPKCPSGRRLWQATVEIREMGNVSFLFNVAY
ncbi:MAG TPA: hypothetical protein VFG09_13530 [Thermodesulfovibrionales bacterium]|nr:hypothetical protein [Thermodesulfovibrionales bacterium]